MSLGHSASAEGSNQSVDDLAEEFAEEIEERMRGAYSRFQRYPVHRGAGFPPHPLFSGDRHGMPSGHDEVSPSDNGSSEVNGSVGFVVRGLWSVHSRRDRCEGNE